MQTQINDSLLLLVGTRTFRHSALSGLVHANLVNPCASSPDRTTVSSRVSSRTVFADGPLFSKSPPWFCLGLPRKSLNMSRFARVHSRSWRLQWSRMSSEKGDKLPFHGLFWRFHSSKLSEAQTIRSYSKATTTEPVRIGCASGFWGDTATSGSTKPRKETIFPFSSFPSIVGTLSSTSTL